jgi:fermentation-respiration switch protein FrsA (DUF1100 family)
MNLILMVLGLLVIFALWLRWREPGMIYYPMRAIDETPAQRGWRFDDVWLTASDRVRINGWFVPGDRDGRLTVLLFHGNAGNISHRFEKLAILRELGANVFIIDYRGYGRSEGKPDESGTYRDAQAAYEYLTKERKLDPRTIVVYGESLGSAVAVNLASSAPVGGVVIEEAFTSISDVGQRMFPFLPVRWLVRNKYDTLSKIGRLNAPLLILHSRDDEYFSMRHAERLLASAREPKQLVELRGGHNDAFLVSQQIYREVLKQFFARAISDTGNTKEP